jgi:hypothetical protein
MRSNFGDLVFPTLGIFTVLALLSPAFWKR